MDASSVRHSLLNNSFRGLNIISLKFNDRIQIPLQRLPKNEAKVSLRASLFDELRVRLERSLIPNVHCINIDKHSFCRMSV